MITTIIQEIIAAYRRNGRRVIEITLPVNEFEELLVQIQANTAGHCTTCTCHAPAKNAVVYLGVGVKSCTYTGPQWMSIKWARKL